MRALGIILLFAAVAAGQTKPLPADVNSESYSRLPLIKRSDYAMAAIMLRAVDQHVPNAAAELPPIKH